MIDPVLPDVFEPFTTRGVALANGRDLDGVSYTAFDGEIGETPEEVQAVLAARGAKGGARYRALVDRWNGDASGLGDTSPSNFDQSLATLLALALSENLELDLANAEHARRVGEIIETALKRRRVDGGENPKDRSSYWSPTISKGLSRALEMQRRSPDAHGIAPQPQTGKSVAKPIAAPCESVDAKDFFDRENGFTPQLMGDCLHAECPVVIGEGSWLYRYYGGVYRSDAEEWIASRVREILGRRFKRRHREETIAWFKSAMSVDTTTPPIDVLNVSNGLLRWDGLVLEPHRHDLITTVQIPVEWNRDAKCPLILAFLRDVLPDEDTVQFVLEIMGYALYPRNLFHIAVLLHGSGRNGKSVLLSILLALLGPESVTAVPLQQFSENRFAAASLVGKLANICGDIDARAIKRTDVFKMITGGDMIHTERKYGQSFSFRSFALPIFSANEPPLSADQSEAWFERWIVVPMNKTISPEKRDSNLTEKLTTRSELEGLLVLAVDGLQRLLARGRFELPGAIQEAQAEYRERLDSVSSFIEADCQFGPNGRTTRTALRAAYMTHCRELELHAVGASQFYDRLRRADPSIKDITIRGTRHFSGVSLR